MDSLLLHRARNDKGEEFSAHIAYAKGAAIKENEKDEIRSCPTVQFTYRLPSGFINLYYRILNTPRSR